MQITCAVILIPACAPCVGLLLNQLNVTLTCSRSWHLRLYFIVILRTMNALSVSTSCSGCIDEIVICEQSLLKTGIAKLRRIKVIHASEVGLVSGGVYRFRTVTKELSHEYVVIGTCCARV